MPRESEKGVENTEVPTKKPRNVKPSDTLPEAGARDTKKKRATMQAFNARINALLKERGAVLEYECPMTDEDSIVPHDVRRWVLATPVGPLRVTATGNGVMCCFHDPAAGAALAARGVSLDVNPHSGKWCTYYFGVLLEIAVADFRDSLDRVLNAFPVEPSKEPAWTLKDPPASPPTPLSAFDEARRYLDARAAGWTDPTVDPWEMIQELLDASHEEVSAAVEEACEEHEKKVEEAEERGKSRAIKDLDVAELGKMPVGLLIRALDVAIRREHDEAERLGEQRAYRLQLTELGSLRDENKILRDQATAVFRAGKETRS